jgi:uncharacterized cupredoxin-like copper-binding protein
MERKNMNRTLRNATLAALATVLGSTALAQGTTAEPAATPATAAPAAAPASEAAAAAPAAKLSYSNKWRIEVSGGANTDGSLVFAVTPKGGETTNVTVKLDDGQGENNVAREIKNQFEKQLNTRKYDIELDDGEDVLVKKDMSEPVFALQLVSSTVKGPRIRLQKE